MSSWDHRKLGVIGLVLAIVLFLALNIFSNSTIRNTQFDLTETGLYTLSDGTREVLADLKEPLTLRFFVSRDLLDASPGLGGYANRVEELIERYATLSGGKLQLELIDPSRSRRRKIGQWVSGSMVCRWPMAVN